jgi:hypothetical protein
MLPSARRAGLFWPWRSALCRDCCGGIGGLPAFTFSVAGVSLPTGRSRLGPRVTPLPVQCRFLVFRLWRPPHLILHCVPAMIFSAMTLSKCVKITR